jgi:uncharacterized protein (TIGR00255 family)
MAQPLASMTGFARTAGSVPAIRFQCEAKSVNARGLDVRLRLPQGHDVLETELRRRIGNTFSRGSITFTLTLEREGSGGEVIINQQALGAVLEALEALAGRIDSDRPRLDGILGLKGVLEQREASLSPEAEDILHRAILDAADIAISDLRQARNDEGERLKQVLLERIDEIQALTQKAENHPSRTRDAIIERLRQQMEDLIQANVNLPDDRLAQEALLLATKADIREELDRLNAHIASAREQIEAGGPVGRKLDFLSQEFNREANTLCSKSNAVELTAIGLDLKAAIDQMREQVQNIE